MTVLENRDDNQELAKKKLIQLYKLKNHSKLIIQQ